MGRSVASSSSKQHPSYRLLEQNAFQQEAYEQYRRRCLKERKAVGTSLPSSGMHNHLWGRRGRHGQSLHRPWDSVAPKLCL